MLKIKLVAIGKVKENSLKQLLAEYYKRMQRYCHLEVIEEIDEKAPENLSEAQERIVLAEEGKRLLRHVQTSDWVVVMDLAGKMLNSVEFAQRIANWQVDGVSTIVVLIGGSLGLSQDVIQRANVRLSLSPMTFPHQLARLMITEQLYRAFKINQNEPYHK